MGKFVNENTQKKAKGYYSAKNPWHESLSDKRGIDRDGKVSLKHLRGERDLAANNPGKERNNKNK
jgi:hypothetical protein